MSKSKEQCINIINQQFHDLKDEHDEKALFIALEKSIKEISSAEFALVWIMDNEANKIKTFYQNRRWELELKESILQKVLLSKKGFFDNYVVSQLQYNPNIDNILKVKIKSMIAVPVLDKAKDKVMAFIVAFNSVNNKEIFRRYDIRSLGLLDTYISNIIRSTTDKDLAIEPLPKKLDRTKIKPLVVQQKETKRVTRKTKMELERELEIQKEKLRLLEEELSLKTEALESKEAEIQDYALTVISEEEVVNPINHKSDIYTIFNFLNNEVSYLANEEHKVYLFLEIIKNSLHNKEQLHFLNGELEKIQLIEKLANALYTREKMPILLEPFNIYQLVNDISTLYSKTFSDKNITFNIFLDPTTPNFLISDKDKIKSLIVHLINNIFNFTAQLGAIELSLNFSDVNELLTLEIKSFNAIETQKTKNFFSHKEVNHSLTSSESGLGLSVGSNLVKILGGKLKLSAMGKEKHLFTVFLPIKQSRESQPLEFHRKDMKVAILMNEENSLAVENLIHYLIVMGIDDKFIFTFKSSKKLKGVRFSHLFCFENIFDDNLDFKSFNSITVLKYSQKRLNLQKNMVNTLYVNSYYGMELQKILFPTMQSVDFKENTLLIEDSFLSKFSSVVKKLKFS
jgi:signal transduction histidine kinase